MCVVLCDFLHTLNPPPETCPMTTAKTAVRTQSFPRTGGGWS